MPQEEKVTFESDGLKLAGIVHIPDDLKAAEQRPAFLVFAEENQGVRQILVDWLARFFPVG